MAQDISDLNSYKYAVRNDIKVYDYSTGPWQTDRPIKKCGLWWIPLGNDGVTGSTDDTKNRLVLAGGQTESEYELIFSGYVKIGKENPKSDIIIGSIVHPPETFERWDYWVKMHEIALDYGFKTISANSLNVDINSSSLKVK